MFPLWAALPSRTVQNLGVTTSYIGQQSRKGDSIIRPARSCPICPQDTSAIKEKERRGPFDTYPLPVIVDLVTRPRRVSCQLDSSPSPPHLPQPHTCRSVIPRPPSRGNHHSSSSLYLTISPLPSSATRESIRPTSSDPPLPPRNTHTISSPGHLAELRSPPLSPNILPTRMVPS